MVILLGGRTGRDGCGGATGSSKSHNLSSLESCGAEVQKGNAPEERKLQRLFRNSEACRMIKRCNDFGAGGVSVAIGELADGLFIDLNAVPKKYEGLDGTELAISESQERMAVVVSAADADRFRALADGENLEATVVARVTAEPRLVMRWNGVDIVNISREFLNSNGAEKHIEITPDAPLSFEKEIGTDFAAAYGSPRAGHQRLFPPRTCRTVRFDHRRRNGADALWRKESTDADSGDGTQNSGRKGTYGRLLRYGMGL